MCSGSPSPRSAWLYHEDLRLRGEMHPCPESLHLWGSWDPHSLVSLEPEMILSRRPRHLVEQLGTAAWRTSLSICPMPLTGHWQFRFCKRHPPARQDPQTRGKGHSGPGRCHGTPMALPYRQKKLEKSQKIQRCIVQRLYNRVSHRGAGVVNLDSKFILLS